ncbi:MAG: IS5 family transposase [Hyphomicrobiaceae bacterium]
MRGSDKQTGSLFSYVNLEERIPARHPLRKIKGVVDAALAALNADFSALYADEGRPSIAPERLLRASLVQILFSIRSETQLMEQLQYNLLFRWFVGLSIDEPVWVATVFTKNRDRLLNTEMSQKLLAAILAHERIAPLLSDDHFSVDGTLVEAWASFKSFKPKAAAPDAPPPDGSPPPPPAALDGGQAADEATRTGAGDMATGSDSDGSTGEGSIGRNVERNWRGETWSNATHASVTDPQARLYRKAKGRPAQLCYMGHALTENRNGFVVATELTHADGTAERRAALAMIERASPGSTRRITLGADKGYDDRGFVAKLRQMCVTPHVAAKARHSAIDARTTRHAGYATSQRKRKLVEEPFGWGKTIGPIAKTMLRGLNRVGAQFTLTMAAYNLARLPRLLAA